MRATRFAMVARLRAFVLIAGLALSAIAWVPAAEQNDAVPAVYARVQQGEYEVTGDIGAVIKRVVKGLAAERGGAKANDLLLAIDEVRLHDAAEASAYLAIRLRDEKPQSWMVKRGDGIVKLT